MKTPEEALKQYNRLMDKIYKELNELNINQIPNESLKRMKLVLKTKQICDAMIKWMNSYYGRGYVHAIRNMVSGLDNRLVDSKYT